MARWAAFLGLTGVVVTLFLLLARLSQTAVRDPPPRLPAGERASQDSPSEPDAATARTHEEGSVPDDGGSGPEYPDADLADTERQTDGPAVPPSASPGYGDPGEGHGAPELTPGVLLANVLLTQGLFGLVLAAGAWYFAVPASALGVGGESALGFAFGVGLGFLLWVGNELAATLADAVGAGYDEQLREMLAPDSALGWGVLFGLVLPVIALVEEFVFRAAIVGVPMAGFGTPAWPLVFVSAGAFALGHGAQGRVGVAVTGGLGLVLAAVYALTGSLLVVAVAHYVVNALEFLVHELLGWSRF